MEDVKRGDMIRILITGGTIDKEYNAVTGELTFTKSHLTNMLNQVRCRAEVILERLSKNLVLDAFLSNFSAHFSFFKFHLLRIRNVVFVIRFPLGQWLISRFDRMEPWLNTNIMITHKAY